MSGDFSELILAITTTKSRLIQTDLFGNEIDLKVVWVFIGIFPASKLGIGHNEWRRVITDKTMLNEIFAS